MTETIDLCADNYYVVEIKSKTNGELNKSAFFLCEW